MCCCSVAKSYLSYLFATWWTAESRLLCPSLSPRVCSDSCPLSCLMPSNRRILCCPVLSLLSFPALRSFPVSWLFESGGQSSGLELQLQHQSFQWISELISFRTDWFNLLATQGTLKSSPAPQFKTISSLVLSLLYGPTLTSIHDYWKNHSFD